MQLKSDTHDGMIIYTLQNSGKMIDTYNIELTCTMRRWEREWKQSYTEHDSYTNNIKTKIMEEEVNLP